MANDRFDGVRQILSEVSERLNNVAREQELFAKEMRELSASQDRLEASQLKTDEQQKKTDEQLKKTDEQLKKTDEQQKKTDEQHKETKEEIEKLHKKTEKEIEKMAKEVGKVTGGLGRVAEGLAAPCVPEVFRELGIEVSAVHQRVKAFKNRQVISEIDLLCPARRNGSSLVLVGEVKAHLTSEFIKYFLEDNLVPFKENFPEYKEKEVIGLVAGLNVDDDAARFAKRKGLYVLAATGETMKILNPVEFKPKLW